ncbi:MXAN_6640 family putative metalloprotease [Nocardioides litoris]|uniref:MXAN_6640 family putative metalloprotease n=1 Tax=Nocardioides litoris TaxID=1926648 RepID=UPI0014776DB2|nr:MXAN_6640 family putative metalloprotease [Nocardioides litoris]
MLAALLLPVVPASAGPAPAPAGAAADVTTVRAKPAPTPPLVAAARALDEPGREATLALRDLFLARPTLGGLGDDFAGGLLARPTDRGGDPFDDGYDTPSTRRCGPRVCVHWVRSGPDAPPSARWAATTLRVVERVWRHHVTRMGFRAPRPDGQRGGDARFDVYLKDLGVRGLYGYCAPEALVPGQPRQASGFCVLDDDFARSQFGRAPQQTLEVTAAHEFFHAVQFAYDVREDPWLLESTATWIEERFADRVDDNRAYLRFGQLGRPRVPLDLFETTGYAHYGNWTFWEHLTDRFGPGLVRRVIERAGTGDGLPDEYSTQALASVLAARGGLPAAYASYAADNTVPARTYPEGASWPAAPVARRTLSRTDRRAVLRTRLDHLTSRSVRLVPARGLGKRSGGGWKVTVTVDAPDRVTAPAARLLVVRRDGRVRARPIALTERGLGRAVVRLDRRRVRSVTVAVVNASTRFRCDRSSTLSCRGVAVDDRQPFVVEAVLRRAARR